MRQMAVGAGGAHFGTSGTVASLTELISSLTAIDVVQAAAKVSIALEQLGRGSLLDSQRDLASEMFSPDVAAGIVADLEAGGAGGRYDALFFPGQLMAMQRLALALGREGPGTSFDDGQLVDRFVMAAAQLNDVRDDLGASDPDAWDAVDMALYAMRAAEINISRPPVVAGGRAFQLWHQSPVPWPAGLEDPESYCHREFGMSLMSFAAIAFAPAIGLFDIKTSGQQVAFSPAAYFAETKIPEADVRTVMSRLTYDARRNPALAEEQGVYWCFYDLADRPLLPCGEDLVVPASLRYATERATTGVFWMMHKSAGEKRGAFTTHFGRMFEEYCLAATHRLISPPNTTVCGEIEYGPRGGRKRSSDVLVVVDEPERAARVFVECRAGRPPRSVFADGDRQAFDSYLDDLKGKLRQLDRSIRDHAAGAFQIPGDGARPDAPYLPVLVVDEPFQWSLPLRFVLDDFAAAAGWFADPRTAPPVVCSIGEYENLVSASERGILPLDVALAIYVDEGREDSLSELLFRRTGPLFASSHADDGWRKFTEATRAELFG